MPRRAFLVGSVTLVATGCGWIISDDRDVPDQVIELFGTMDPSGSEVGVSCRILVDDVELVAVDKPEGKVDAPVHWYFAPTDAGGGWHVFVRVDDSGRIVDRSGERGGCDSVRTLDDDLWPVFGGGSDTEVVHAGHAPKGARSVRLTLGDHEPVTVEVNADGNYILVLTESSCCSWAELTALEALDADGNVIASAS